MGTVSTTTEVSLFSWFPLMFFTFFIVVFNLLIVVAFIVKKDIRRRIVNVIFCNQAVIDIFIATIFIPCYSASKYNVDMQGWNTGLLMYLFFVFTSLLNILLISTERYVMLRKEKFDRVSAFVKKRIYHLIAAVWCLPLILYVVSLIIYKTSAAVSQENVAREYDVFATLLYIVVAVAIVYLTKQSMKIVQHQKIVCQEILKTFKNLDEAFEAETLLTKLNNDQNTVRLVALLIVCLTTCYVPHVIFSFQLIADKTALAPSDVLTYVFVTKSLINPVVMLLCLDDYKATVYDYLGGNRFVYPTEATVQ